jgi:hypothetical protein
MASVDALIETITREINSMKSEAEDALERLEDVADFQATISFPSRGTVELSRQSKISADDMPVLEKPTLPSSLLLEYEAFDRYNTHVWNAATLDTIQAKLLEYIDSGGTGISEDVQQAMFDADRERKLQALRDGLDLAGARSGARGLRYPNSMTKAQQSELLQKYQFDLENQSREITRLVADLAQKNIQFAISQNVDVEKFHADFAIRFADLYKGLITALLDRFRAEVTLYVAQYEAELKVLLANIEVAKLNATLDQEYQTMILSKWQMDLNESTERTKALIQQEEQKTVIKKEVAAALAQAYIGMANTMQANGIVSLTGEG